VPIIHPGRVKYGDQPESLFRVLYLCWMVIAKIGDITMRELGALGPDTEEISVRKWLCNRIIDLYNQEAASLIAELEAVKKELSRHWGAANWAPIILTEAARSAISADNARVQFSFEY
jgi:hypothetical protein